MAGSGRSTRRRTTPRQSYIVVDTGPWIFGKKVMLPAGVINRVDFDTETVYVSRSKDEIKNAPEFDESRYHDDAYRAELGGYYGAFNRLPLPRVGVLILRRNASGRAVLRLRLAPMLPASPRR